MSMPNGMRPRLATKHLIWAGVIVLVVVVAALNRTNEIAPSDNSTGGSSRVREVSPETTRSVPPRSTSEAGSIVSKNDLIFDSVRNARVLSFQEIAAGDIPHVPSGTYSASVNGGWMSTDTISASAKDSFIVEITVDFPRMARGFLIDSCGSRGKARRCSELEVQSLIAKYLEDPCGYLSGKYGLCQFAFYNRKDSEIYRTDKWGGQRVLHCERSGDDVRALLGPAVERPSSLALAASGPLVPLK